MLDKQSYYCTRKQPDTSFCLHCFRKYMYGPTIWQSELISIVICHYMTNSTVRICMYSLSKKRCWFIKMYCIRLMTEWVRWVPFRTRLSKFNVSSFMIFQGSYFVHLSKCHAASGTGYMALSYKWIRGKMWTVCNCGMSVTRLTKVLRWIESCFSEKHSLKSDIKVSWRP